MKEDYPVSFEIASPAAMFTRPDTGEIPKRYPLLSIWSVDKTI